MLYRHNTEDNVGMPGAVLGHQEKSAKERLAVMFHFSPPYPSVCFICELGVLLSSVLNMPQIFNPGGQPNDGGLRARQVGNAKFQLKGTHLSAID